MMMAGDEVKARVQPRISMATAETVESTMTGLHRAGRHVQRNPQRKVTDATASVARKCSGLDEQEKAGEDAFKDIGGLSNAF